MICKTCGRNAQNEEANFCEYCGSSFRERVQTVVNAAPQKQIVAETIGSEKPVSFLNWLGSMAILLALLFIPIPLVGMIIFMAVLCVWAFGNNTPISKKNWARASLIFVGVLFILMTILMYTIMSNPVFQDYMNQILSTYGTSI